jgi:hypothetical protein
MAAAVETSVNLVSIGAFGRAKNVACLQYSAIAARR